MIDYTNQINLSRRISKMRTEILEFVAEMVKETIANNEKPWGMFVVVGNFAPVSYKLESYNQIGDSELTGHAILYGTKQFKDALRKYRYSDGAFVLDSASGQLLGNRVLYLNLKSDIQEEKGARHHAAASVSKDQHIDFALTVSEETKTIRVYVKGSVEESVETANTDGEATGGQPQEIR